MDNDLTSPFSDILAVLLPSFCIYFFPATYLEPSPFSNFPHQIICIMLLTSLFLPALRNGLFLLSWLLYLFHDLVTCEDLKPGASHQREYVTFAFLVLGCLTQYDLFWFYHFACYVHYFTFLYSWGTTFPLSIQQSKDI